MAFASFDGKGGSAPMSDINMVPLIDVMLVLLVIFIVTAPLLTHAVKLDLPKVSSTPNQLKPDKIEFAVDASGQRYWNGEAVTRDEAAKRFLPRRQEAAAARGPPARRPCRRVRRGGRDAGRCVEGRPVEDRLRQRTRRSMRSCERSGRFIMVDAAAPPSAARRSLSLLDWRHAAWLLLGLALLACWAPRAHAADAVPPQERGATIVHLLDYVAVDYPEFVKDGKVLDEAEYKEQLDFVGQAITSLELLPDNPARAQLLDQARPCSRRCRPRRRVMR